MKKHQSKRKAARIPKKVVNCKNLSNKNISNISLTLNDVIIHDSSNLIQDKVCAVITIPYDILVLICQYLKYEHIVNFLKTSHMFYATLMDNNFWHILVIRDHKVCFDVYYVDVITDKFFDIYKIFHNMCRAGLLRTSIRLNSVCKIHNFCAERTLHEHVLINNRGKNETDCQYSILKNFTNLISLEILTILDHNMNDTLFFNNIKTLTHLHIGWIKLTELPPVICQLVNLEHLDLSVNRIHNLPDSIHNLTKLKKLNLGSNELCNLPDAVYKMTNLNDLNVYNNRLTCLHKSFSNLKLLTNLDIYSNKFEKFPEIICNLTTLKHLNMHGNNLSDISSRICELINLEDINLSGNTLKTLPNTFTKLVSLKMINFRGNDLDNINDHFSGLPMLEELDLTQNNLTSVPEFVYTLMGKVTISLVRNRITFSDIDLQIFPPHLIDDQQFWFMQMQKQKLRPVQ